jgi:hypothetical protein
MTDASINTASINTESINKQMDHTQNALSCIFAIISVGSCYTKMYFIETSIAFSMYYLYDFKQASPIYKMHHLLGLSFLAETHYINYKGESITDILDIILNIEFTTPFMILCLYYNNNLLKLLFFVLFFYCRIYKQYMFLLNNHMITLYPLYILNLFWFMKMIRKMNLFNDPKYIFHCQQIASYIYFLDLYFFTPNIQGLSILCLSITNYFFHQKKYQIMKYNKPSTEIVPYIIAHTFCIHLRCISFVNPPLYLYSIPLHIISFTTKIIYTNPENLNSTYLFTSPMLIDLILNFNKKIELTIYLFLFLYVKPFRHMNFVFFRLILFQRYLNY